MFRTILSAFSHLSLLRVMLLLTFMFSLGCQGTGMRNQSNSPWPHLSSEDPVARIQAIHAIQSTNFRRNAPYLFPLLNDPDQWVRFNARSAILILAGDHRQSAPPYDYLATPQNRRKSIQHFREWWNRTFSPPPA
ncbi:MAG: HEAT repeat domain-containing protein [Planctomycetota bacterium]